MSEDTILNMFFLIADLLPSPTSFSSIKLFLVLVPLCIVTPLAEEKCSSLPSTKNSPQIDPEERT